MDLTVENKQKLESKGLRLFGGTSQSETRYWIFKPTEVKGNFIWKWEGMPLLVPKNENYEDFEEYVSDMPMLRIWFRFEKWEVEHHAWVPGPGPGDFRLEFEGQSQAADFILSYYFGKNKYFTELHDDFNKRRNALKKEELKALFQLIIDSIDASFPETEIEFETTLYKQTPIDTWAGFPLSGRVDDSIPFKFDLGSLSRDAHELKKILYDDKKCTPSDWARLASVLTELTRMGKA